MECNNLFILGNRHTTIVFPTTPRLLSPSSAYCLSEASAIIKISHRHRSATVSRLSHTSPLLPCYRHHRPTTTSLLTRHITSLTADPSFIGYPNSCQKRCKHQALVFYRGRRFEEAQYNTTYHYPRFVPEEMTWAIEAPDASEPKLQAQVALTSELTIKVIELKNELRRERKLLEREQREADDL